ncbi:putative lipid II flippase FtsW [Candidiatus Paracoxiella cheracis]|uniref:putative lipid II flippase FtsW n=1 Tax=Candidiatus Paracoxiella cheracis TaxID=3405120 RepID=UPI003BF52B0E
MKIHYDRWILVSTLALLTIGLLMVASASMVISDQQYGYPFHYFIHESVYLIIGLTLAWVATKIPIKLWKKYSGYLLVLSFLLLIAVLIPGIGKVVNGSRRWLNFGIISLQVSEAVKFSAILYLASYLQRYQNQVRYELKGFIKPMVLLALMAMLLLLEPDFGAVAVLTVTFLVLLFLANVRLWPFCVLFLVVVVALSALAILSPYRLERLTTFLNPWHTQYGSGYQLTQSLIAFGRGGLFGVGLGNSVQKLYYLPEAHTDFLFAVLAEELGLVGELIVVALFTALVIRIFMLARRAQLTNDPFSAYVAYGVGLWIGLQTMINMGVNVGILPTKGLTLPFISYGGSSMLVNCVVIGIVLRIAYETSVSDGNIKSRTKLTQYQQRKAR